MSRTKEFLKNILGDTHQGRLIDKLGNFATENFGDPGLHFFNTLTAAQVLYQLYDAKEEKKEAARGVLGKVIVERVQEFCKKERDPAKQKEFAAQQLAIYELALSRI